MSFLPLNTMLGKLQIIKVLDWYDGPRLFIAENASGTRYIAFWADELENESLWLYSSVSERRIESIISGQFDLRSIYTNPEDEIVFLVHLPHCDRALVEVFVPKQIDSDILPPEDDFLILDDDFLDEYNQGILKSAELGKIDNKKEESRLQSLLNKAKQLRTTDDILAYANLLYQIGCEYETLRDWENARIYYRDSLRLYIYLNYPSGIAQSHVGLGKYFVFNGYLEKGIDELLIARKSYDRLQKADRTAQVDKLYQSARKALNKALEKQADEVYL